MRYMIEEGIVPDVATTKCIINECGEHAYGLVCVNDKATGITMLMIPACQLHGNELETKHLTITIRSTEQFSATLTDEEPPEATAFLYVDILRPAEAPDAP
jgi:hypothetical protein